MEYFVYCHVSPSGKKYVGISSNPEKRWNNGKGYIKNYAFYRAIKKYGWSNFQHIILFSGLSEHDAREIEYNLIDEWKLTDRKYGYNLRAGGDGPFSDESRKLMSDSRIGNQNCVNRVLSDETKSKISQSLSDYYKKNVPPFRGKKHSKETIEKMKSRVVSEETKHLMRKKHPTMSGENNPSAKAIRQLSLSGDIIKEYKYAKLASDDLCLDLSSIIKCCRGVQKTCGGYRWEYV